MNNNKNTLDKSSRESDKYRKEYNSRLMLSQRKHATADIYNQKLLSETI